MIAQESLLRLEKEFTPFKRIGVAFSGGVDSAVLLKSAAHFLGTSNVIAFLGVSDSLAQREREIAIKVAREIGVELVEISTDEMSNPNYLANNGQRCYFCKESLFSAIASFDYSQFRLDAIAYGENFDDSRKLDRPGQRAALEFGVIKPLSSAGLSKNDVRLLAHHFSLSVAEKPASPCLASRIKPFTQVTKLALSQVEALEDFLLQLGFHDVRARYLENSLLIEVTEEEQNLLSQISTRESIQLFGTQHDLPTIEFSTSPLRSGSFSAEYLESAHV
ncbi:MAG: asparagine synthase-related protein [Candidatus Nanopelagicaceae bacterium]